MNRSTLVFLPGLLCDEFLWREQARDLADLATPVIADLTQDDSVAAMARRVLTIAPPCFALAALSMGGYVAFEVLRQAPERVTRLALLDTSASPDDETRVVQRRTAIESLQHGQFIGVTRRLLPQLVHASHVTGLVGGQVQAMAARVGGETFLRQQRAILGRADYWPLLATIRVPTLVAVGENDLPTPVAEAWAIHQGIVDSHFHQFAGCGHLPPLEQPQATSALLRGWLQGAVAATEQI